MRRIAVLVTTLALLAGACAAGEEADEAAGPVDADEAPAVEETQEEEEATGGTLVVAIGADPGHLNPAITTSGGTHTASELLYNGLVELDENLEPVAELAESWEIEEDGRVYRFHLRDDVMWHDGEPFTSADVKFSFEEILLQFHSRTKAALETALEAIETPDDHTVVFRFVAPYAPLLQQLNVTEAPIVAKHVYEGGDPQEHPANLEPVGTGPFRFVSYTPDQEIRLEANPDYFKKGLPKLDEVVMRVILDAGSQVIAFESGEVDWLWGVPGPDLARLGSDPDVEFLRTAVNPGGANCIMTVSFNLERPTFADVRVRRAIAHALNRDQFLERAQFGEGRVAEAPISSGIPWAHADGLAMPSFDVAEAERLLDEAGWVRDGSGTRTAQGVDGVADGTALAFDFIHFPTFAAYGELFRAHLTVVGADVTLRSLEPPTAAQTIFTDRDFDTVVISYCNATDPEIGVRRMYISSNIGPIPFSNAATYRNDEVDRLFDEAQATIGLDERGEIYRSIQEFLVEDLPYFWLVETEATRAFRAGCSGFSASGHFAEAASCSR